MIPVKNEEKTVTHTSSENELKKKKSFSIDSFTSSIPIKSRSTSKSRKFSIFHNNHSKITTNNLLETLSKNFKQKEKLNTTVKKVKKQINFDKTCHNMISNLQDPKKFKNNKVYDNEKNPVKNTLVLKQILEKRLSKTCSTKFFDGVTNLQENSNHNYQEKTQIFPLAENLDIASTQEQELKNKNQIQMEKERESVKEELKKEIIEQLFAKERQNYDNLVKDLELKLSNKFDLILEKISQQSNNNKTIKNETKITTNTSIIQKDPSKIIKSKTKKTSISETPKEEREKIVPNHQEKDQKREFFKNKNNILSSESSVDSIDIIDSRYQKTINQVKPEKENVKEYLEIKHVQEKENNFYLKRIKEQKNKMEKSIKNFKIACDNLLLPVNETFLVIFALSYKEFCETNSLSMESIESNQILFSKYSSETELKSKLPVNEEKFLFDSLLKIEKMINLKCPADKKVKIEEFTKNCIECIENVFFEKPNLNLENEPEILKKIKEIKSYSVRMKQSNI